MTHALAVQSRTEKAEDLRAAGQIPGVLYGPEIEPVKVSVEYNTFKKMLDEAGQSSMIDVTVDGKDAIPALIQDLQYDVVKDQITHIDFRQIKMGEEMAATISLEFVGEPPAVKMLGGTLTLGAREVNVKCLPKDLVSSIEVDLSVIADFDTTITIGDVKLPAGMTVTDEPSTTVATVAAPLTEDQLKEMEEGSGGDIADIEVEGGKEDGAEEKKDAPAEDKKEDA